MGNSVSQRVGACDERLEWRERWARVLTLLESAERRSGRWRDECLQAASSLLGLAAHDADDPTPPMICQAVLSLIERNDAAGAAAMVRNVVGSAAAAAAG